MMKSLECLEQAFFIIALITEETILGSEKRLQVLRSHLALRPQKWLPTQGSAYTKL